MRLEETLLGLTKRWERQEIWKCNSKTGKIEKWQNLKGGNIA